MSHPDDRHAPTSPRPASEARRAASRANGARSRGPTTPEGLARSRANALKHGLTGAGDVLPPDLAADAVAKFDDYCRALRPDDEVQRDLAQRAALAAVRLNYCQRHEAARLQQRVASAEADWDEREAAEADAAECLLIKDPRAALRLLRRTAEGARRLMERWQELGRALEKRGHWDEERLEHAAALLGYGSLPDEAAEPEVAELVRHALGAMPAPDPDEVRWFFGDTAAEGDSSWGRLPPMAEARAYLEAFVAAEVARLESLRDWLWEHVDAPERAAAAERALFDAGPEAVRLRQYESACERERSRALAELERLKKARAQEEQAPPSRRENEPGAPAEPAGRVAATAEVAPGATSPTAGDSAAPRVQRRRENEPGARPPDAPIGPEDQGAQTLGDHSEPLPEGPATLDG
jgi:hypothetical protein